MNSKISDSSLNNVVVGIQKQCYSIQVTDDIKVEFDCLYIRRVDDKLEGHILKLKDDQYADRLIFAFSLEMSNYYDGLNIIDVYNTFQSQKRNAYELLDFFTIKREELQPYFGKTVDFGTKQRGVKIIDFIDKHKYYERIFSNIQSYREGMTGDFIYLMLDNKSSHVKIGKSIHPFYRERTLQSQEPRIGVIAVWKAPPEIERQLHKQFATKRVRGEWFNLNLEDLHLIKEQMSVYSMLSYS